MILNYHLFTVFVRLKEDDYHDHHFGKGGLHFKKSAIAFKIIAIKKTVALKQNYTWCTRGKHARSNLLYFAAFFSLSLSINSRRHC